MRQLRKLSQNIQIRQFRKVILREYQGREVGDRIGEGGLYAIHAVARKEQGVEARGQREVGEGGDVVVRQVDGVLVLSSRLNQHVELT